MREEVIHGSAIDQSLLFLHVRIDSLSGYAESSSPEIEKIISLVEKINCKRHLRHSRSIVLAALDLTSRSDSKLSALRSIPPSDDHRLLLFAIRILDPQHSFARAVRRGEVKLYLQCIKSPLGNELSKDIESNPENLEKAHRHACRQAGRQAGCSARRSLTCSLACLLPPSLQWFAAVVVAAAAAAIAAAFGILNR